MLVVKEVNLSCTTDADNLYGWAMSQYLQYSGFKWF